MMMTKKAIRLAVAKLEGQKPKNTDEFELKESKIKRLLDLCVSMELI